MGNEKGGTQVLHFLGLKPLYWSSACTLFHPKPGPGSQLKGTLLSAQSALPTGQVRSSPSVLDQSHLLGGHRLLGWGRWKAPGSRDAVRFHCLKPQVKRGETEGGLVNR